MGAGAHPLVAECRRLDVEARWHKGLVNRHRRLAREARAKQAEIERQLAGLGIKVTYQAKEESPHGRQQDDAGT